MRSARPVTIVLAALLTTATITACSASDPEVIDVYAASSLTDAFTTFEAAFEADNPTIDVRLNLAGSTTLQRQILDGARADVFAPADVDLLEPFVEPNEADVYATNTLALVVPASGERLVDALDDLSSSDILTARCARGVPCGAATDHFLDRAGVTLGRATDEPNVRAVLIKVARGEADAGFVYLTDARRDAEVAELPITDAPTVSYAAVVLSTKPAAASFAEYLHSPAGAAVLRDLDFIVP